MENPVIVNKRIWLITLGIVNLSSYYGNKLRSVSVIVVNGFELEPCRENLHRYFESKVERISFG
jgi:hypothetical protein